MAIAARMSAVENLHRDNKQKSRGAASRQDKTAFVGSLGVLRFGPFRSRRGFIAAIRERHQHPDGRPGRPIPDTTRIPTFDTLADCDPKQSMIRMTNCLTTMKMIQAERLVTSGD